jgi:hypothetical protein
MSNRKWLNLVIAFVILMASASQIASAQQTTSTATMAVSAVTSGNAVVGGNFTTEVQVSIDTTGTGLLGIELYLNYNPAILTPNDVTTATPGVQPAVFLTDFFESGPTPAANEALVSPGVAAPNIPMPGRTCPQDKYPCIHLSMTGYKAQTKRSGSIARISWKGVSAGTGNFEVLNPVTASPFPAQPRTAFTDANGFLIPLNSVAASAVTVQAATPTVTPTATATATITATVTVTPTATVTPTTVITPTPTVVAGAGRTGGIVSRQGVPPGVPNTGTQGCTRVDVSNTGQTQTLASAFTLMAASTMTTTFPAEVNTAGGFVVNIPSGSGTYTVRASYPGYLAAEKSGVAVANNATVLVGPTKLSGGDVNGDGAINILDIVIIIGNMGTSSAPVGSSAQSCGALAGTQFNGSTTPPTDSAVDLNDDGIIDISDLAIAAGNFAQSAPTSWAP